MDISICVGSSCHLKGSYNIIKRLEQMIEEYGIQNQVTLKASFCLGHCTDVVAAKIGDDCILGLSMDNVEDIFMKYVLDGIK